ncbi:PHP domain-containing protein [archaeon]|jgi:3',5'-nucleoside bisphosphate phosphatase|nr:PHP domain-containing protein [archaeon]
MKIDLHLHSFYSDGEDSPKELLKKIEKNNVSFFSICDHNYISPESIELQNIAKKKKITFFPGVEISCIDRITDKSLHILGYFKNINIDCLNLSLKPTVDGYNRRAKKIIRKLNNRYNGLNLNFEKLRLIKNEAYISRNTLAMELIKFFGDSKITLKEVLRETYIEESDSWMLDSKEAIEIINSAGGIAVLAHPGNLIKNKIDFEILLKRLVKYGIAGIESYYPKYSDNMVTFLNYIGNKHNLTITAGSDWHGENYTPDRIIGFEIDHYIAPVIKYMNQAA